MSLWSVNTSRMTRELKNICPIVSVKPPAADYCKFENVLEATSVVSLGFLVSIHYRRQRGALNPPAIASDYDTAEEFPHSLLSCLNAVLKVNSKRVFYILV